MSAPLEGGGGSAQVGVCLPDPTVNRMTDACRNITFPHLLLRTVIITARKRSLGQGNIFTGMCQSFCPWGREGSLYDVTSCLAAWSHVPSRGSP